MPRKATQSCETEKREFPTRLRKVMEQKSLTPTALGELIGMRRQTISLYCLGQSSPTVETISKLVDVLDVSADYLLGKTEAPTKDVELRSVCDYTSLHHTTVKYLHSVNDTEERQLINYFFANCHRLIGAYSEVLKKISNIKSRLPISLEDAKQRNYCADEKTISKYIDEIDHLSEELEYMEFHFLNVCEKELSLLSLFAEVAPPFGRLKRGARLSARTLPDQLEDIRSALYFALSDTMPNEETKFSESENSGEVD